MPKRGVRRRETTGRDQRHGVIDGIKWRHPGNPERERSASCESQIEKQNVFGCHMGERGVTFSDQSEDSV
ncbi:hypothetical protein FBY10_1148 [Pseudomonas sp. SJZ103]|nr:hypothetical protein FBY10_1148 [Pseudomonas sp. SJZ103]TWC80461.1 hypothetical protein FBY08_1158 [Pseudomonas sp. SJZ094]